MEKYHPLLGVFTFEKEKVERLNDIIDMIIHFIKNGRKGELNSLGGRGIN